MRNERVQYCLEQLNSAEIALQNAQAALTLANGVDTIDLSSEILRLKERVSQFHDIVVEMSIQQGVVLDGVS